MAPLRIFIGYDPREALAYHVCVNSLIRYSSSPLAITPLALDHLKPVYEEGHADGSNAFIYSRFLVPYLSGFSGMALYLDGDMIVRGDVTELFNLSEVGKDVYVVKHDYKTRHAAKYFGSKNEDYPRKNWSSVILWNCSNFPNRVLRPEFVASKDGSYLHRFSWLMDERIGTLPIEWNWLVGEYELNDKAKLYHYTIGVPAFKDYESCDNASEWWDEYHKTVDLG